MRLELKGKTILVLGLGDTGWSMARWLARRGARVRVADSRANPPFAAQLAAELPQVELRTGAFDAGAFSSVDAIAVSPGVDRRESLIADAIGRGVPVVGDVELFAQALEERTRSSAQPAAQAVAITGSNGKSTVTAMAGDMCASAGLRTVVAGNIGLPVLDALSHAEDAAAFPDVFVLELSSFQLESTTTLEPAAATMLNLSEDHMDRYRDLADYAAAKARIFAGHGIQVVNREDAWSLGMKRPGRDCVTFGLDAAPGPRDWGIVTEQGRQALAQGSRAVMGLEELPVAGLHNAANALAALALTRAIGADGARAVDALRHFRGLPHRVEKVETIRGITFYDDSKGTNVGATVAALLGMAQPVVLIAGGDGKGQDFHPLVRAVKDKARAVVLIGRDAPAIRSVLDGTGVHLFEARSMEDAVRRAFEAASAGDAVLLSPACASYDMFRNYIHRAEVFVAAVHDLAASGG